MLRCIDCGRTFPVEDGFCPMDGTALVRPGPAPDSEGGSRVGQLLSQRYRIEEKIGEGGMAEIYRVTHTAIGRSFAAKFVRHGLRNNQDVVTRFLREAQIASCIKHPNVVSVTDFGETADGEAFCIMELLQGETLADRLQRDGALEPRQAMDIALQLCRGLSAAHRAGVVHRDLKPENVVICGDLGGVVKLIDFGVAQAGSRITAAGVALGTAEYMAPEQVRSETVDGRADLYALGVMLHEMLTTQVPFCCADVAETLQSHLYSRPPSLAEVQPSLAGLRHADAAIARLLSKRRADRPAVAEDAGTLVRSAIEADLPRPAPKCPPGLRSTLVLGSAAVPEDMRPTADSCGLPADGGEQTPPGWSSGAASALAPPRRRAGAGSALPVVAAAAITIAMTLGIHHLFGAPDHLARPSVRTSIGDPSTLVATELPRSAPTEASQGPGALPASLEDEAPEVESAVPVFVTPAPDPRDSKAPRVRLVPRPRATPAAHRGRPRKAPPPRASRPARAGVRTTSRKPRFGSPPPVEDLRDPFSR